MPRQEGLKFEVVDGIRKIKLGAYMTTGTEATARAMMETAVYGTVCTVVWEDGGSNPASYPIQIQTYFAEAQFYQLFLKLLWLDLSNSLILKQKL